MLSFFNEYAPTPKPTERDPASSWDPDEAAPAMAPRAIRYRESEIEGNACHMAVPPEHKIRRMKGDLGFADLPPPRSLSHGGVPWDYLTDGRK